ncbi:MAG: tetratricopeptide repeat protein, partial [Bacteroidetes bacterium]
MPFRDYNDAGYSKSLMGSCFWELGKYDSAAMAHKESISLRRSGGNISGQADSWKKIGELYLLSGLKKDALTAYDSSATLYQQIKDSSGMAETYNKKGKVFLNDENYKVAVDYFEKAKGIISKTTVESLYNLGIAWAELDTSKARFYYSACKEKSGSTGNLGYLFLANKALAGLAYKSGASQLGDKLFDECVAISKQLKTSASTANYLVLKADKYYYQAQPDSALFYYNEAFEIFDTVSKDDAIWQLDNISNTQVSLGNFAEAAVALKRAIEIAKSTSNNLALGYSLQASSFLYGLTGEFEEGIKNSDSAIAIFNRSGNMLRLANTYVARGTLLKSMGEYNRSINSFLFADSIYQAELTKEYRHTALNNIGVTYYSQNDFQNALKYFDMALKQLKQGIIDETYLLYKGNYAECEYYLKRYKEAETTYQEVFPLAKEKKLNRIASGMALGLGKLFYETNRLSEAVEYFQYARDYAVSSGEKEKIVESLTYLGRINVQNVKYDSAEGNFRKAISVAAEFKTVGGWESYYELGLLLFNYKKYDSSIIYLKHAVDLLNKDAENLYGGDEAKKVFNNDPRKSDLYNKITFAYYNTGNEKEAWAYANRSNIAGLKELSGSLTTNASDKDKSEALKKLLSLQQSKKALENTAEKQTGDARQRTVKKIEILEADYTDLSSYFAKSNADQFYNYKSKIPNDVAVALYLVNDKTLMIFTLTNEKLAIDTMTADISKTVSAFIAATKQVQNTTGTAALHLRSEPTDEDETTVKIPFKDLSSEL